MMRRLLFLLALCSLSAHAQLWSGVLNPVPSNGTAACTGCAVDWSTAGIPGGIPSGSWTQSGSTIQASACGNGSTDCSATIQTALNACGTDHYVLLGTGTFLLHSHLSVPSNCALRGSGASATILNDEWTGGAGAGLVELGGIQPLCWSSTGCPSPIGESISGGDTAGSMTISVSKTGTQYYHETIGQFMLIDQANDGTIVTADGAEGDCSDCDLGQTSTGNMAQGQLSIITGCDGITKAGHQCSSGSNITISPSLFVDYTHGPVEIPLPISAQYAGVENLQVYANGTSGEPNFEMDECAYCWVSGVEGNYTDADHLDTNFCYHCEVINSYFSNTFGSGPGPYDHGLRLATKTTLSLVQNNIFERTGVMESEWGAAANVWGYNFKTGGYGDVDVNYEPADIEAHGASPQFVLWEGNIVNKVQMDSIHGSTTNDTFFRDWIRGANISCNPLTGVRATVSCTPTGVEGKSGINGWWDYQSIIANSIDFLSTFENFVGEVIGSTDMNSLTDEDAGSKLLVRTDVLDYSATADRVYDGDAYGFTFGFGNTGDTGSGGLSDDAGCTDSGLSYPCHSVNPATTAFVQGVSYMLDGSTTWVSGVTQTLPPSFYLAAQPSWWVFPNGTVSPWPAVGPDVTGGLSEAGGHAYLNPAANCFYNVMGGTLGGQGSPLVFNASTCYPDPSDPAPAAPANLTGTVVQQ